MVTNEASQEATSTAHFAWQTFTTLHQAILLHESQSLAGEIEAIHDMRVGCRRLRVALSNFAACLPTEDRKRLNTRLKVLADALGNVRDLDVMIAALKNKQPERHQAINSLLRRLRIRRKQQLGHLAEYFRSKEYFAFKQELSAPLLETLTHGKTS